MSNPYLETQQILQAQSAALAEAIVERQYARQADFWKRFGEAGRTKAVRDQVYHLAYLTEAVAAVDPTLFVEYVAWAKGLFAGLGFPEAALLEALQCTVEVLQEEGAPELQTACDYVTQAIHSLPQTPAAPESFLQANQPLGSLADSYLAALLRGEHQAAGRLILEAVKAGTPVREIYLHVFQPVQREVGRLWQINRLSVAQEHYCTAATQLVMSQLYPQIFSGERQGRRAVVTCVGGELHEIGARMVADFLEMGGWDTHFLGANTPRDSVIAMALERQAHVLAISVTMTFHVSQAAELIAGLRAADPERRIKVLVGGYPFNLAPNLWQRLGADGYAADAQTALSAAQRLTSESAAETNL